MLPPPACLVELPDELQVRILSFLPPLDLLRMTAVCRKWKRLALEGSLWAQIHVAPYYRFIPADQLIRLGMAGSGFLRVANFRGCIQLTGHGLRILSEHCPNVHVLVLKDCRGLSTHSISCFLQASAHLRVLDLSGLDTVRNSTLHHVGHLPQLHTLNVAWCRNVSGAGIQAVASGCRRLATLRLDGCQQLDTSTMDTLGRCLARLSCLALNACASLTDDALLALLEHRPPLKKLDLSGCARLSDATLRHLALHCSPKLTHLQLASCVLLTDQGFCFLAPRLRSLVHLDLEDLQHVTGATVKALANHQPSLTHLCLSNCAQVSDDAIVDLILRGACRHTLAHLELDNSIITDDALNSIATSISSLSKTPDPLPALSIDVLDCANITEKGIRKALAKAGPRLSIKSFYSWKWDDDSDEREDDAIALTLREQPRLPRRGPIGTNHQALERHRRRSMRRGDRSTRRQAVAAAASQHQCIIL